MNSTRCSKSPILFNECGEKIYISRFFRSVQVLYIFMPRKKQYVINDSKNSNDNTRVNVSVEPERAKPREARISFVEVLGEEARIPGEKSLDLQNWLGQGIDAWVWATINCLLALLKSGTRSPSTVRRYSDGMKQFFNFLTLGGKKVTIVEPSHLNPLHITQYIGWIKNQGKVKGLSDESVRGNYQGTKSTIKEMIIQGLISGHPSRFFPHAALSNGNGKDSRHTALSDTEQQRLAAALKADLVELHHGKLKLPPSEIITNRYLIVVMRTGGNVTPFLELNRNALKPGLLPGTMRVRTFKRRGFKVEERAVKRGHIVETPTVIPADAAAVLQKTIVETEILIKEAPPSLKNRVWLYARSHYNGGNQRVGCLNQSTLKLGIASLIKRRGIVDDKGLPLVLNVTRLRKSFGKRAFRISNGDLFATAEILGDTPRVTDYNYLGIDNQLEAEGAEFVGKELMIHLRGDGTHFRQKPVMQLGKIQETSKTPVASCQDTLYGTHAPKDGSNHCDLFIRCLFCPSFAVVGELDDLWRLFSYQIFAKGELGHIDMDYGPAATSDFRVERLKNLYRLGISFIDDFTVKAFGHKLCMQAKKMAARELHPFWKLQSERELKRRETGRLANGK